MTRVPQTVPPVRTAGLTPMPETQKGPGQGPPPHNVTDTDSTGLPDIAAVITALQERGHQPWEVQNPNSSLWFVRCPNHPFSSSGVRIGDGAGSYDWACLTITPGDTRCTPNQVIDALGVRDLFPATEAQPDEAAVLALMAEMLDSDELDQIPDPEPLIEGLLDLDTLSWIIGRSGNGKTFVTIDICGSVATGTPWHGHKSVQGKVVYVVAEGARGFKKRIRAWEKHHNLKMGKNLLVLPRPVLVNEAEWGALVEACRRIGAVLIVLDTMARVSAGMEENSSKDMGILVHQAERLREACGACVTLVHHQGHKGENGRGSSALIGAMNTEIRVSMDKKTRIVTVENSKQKDEAEGDDLKFLLTPVNLGVNEKGKPQGSAVLVETTLPTSDEDDDADGLSGNPAEIVKIMREHFPFDTATQVQVKGLAMGQPYGMAKSSFYRAWKRLVEEKVLQPDGRSSTRFRLVSLAERYPDLR
ncbi:AAA family ATPase [Micromonospora noduli]|uniref:AAA family ATPase n=1 Tax=Micromonospora noduli TaxID=709876 RepID=UPI00124B15A0|nr:AAA family ATPase [Micromonospora noduli]KAB1925142.1 AAA family ATPase [Micromonospora noduli]